MDLFKLLHARKCQFYRENVDEIVGRYIKKETLLNNGEHIRFVMRIMLSVYFKSIALI